MAAIHETAYPRIKSSMSQGELDRLFTPSDSELAFARAHTRSPKTRFGFLILLKCSQRLGYFPNLEDVSYQVTAHISKSTGISQVKNGLTDYQNNGYRYRHIPVIREYLGMVSYDKKGQHLVIRSIAEASQSKDDLTDLINFGIESLVKSNFEIPKFSLLLKAAQKVRYLVNKSTYFLITSRLTNEQLSKIEQLFITDPERSTSFWYDLKQDPGPATLQNMRVHADRLEWLKSLNPSLKVFSKIPYTRYRRFVSEAISLDLARMKKMENKKRIALAASLIQSQTCMAYDDLADMYIKICSKMHWTAKRKLEELKLKNQEKTDKLVGLLASIAQSWEDNTGEHRENAIKDIFDLNHPKEVLKECNEHLAYAGNNWLPLLIPYYNSRRKSFFKFIQFSQLQSTSGDKRLECAIEFIKSQKNSKKRKVLIKDYLRLTRTDKSRTIESLEWIPEKWWELVVGTKKTQNTEMPEYLNRKMLELCVFTCVMQELKSGDLFIPQGERFGDWRKELINKKEFQSLLKDYCKRIGLPDRPKDIISTVKNGLIDSIKRTDLGVPENQYLTFDGQNISLKKLKRKPEPPGLVLLEKKLEAHLSFTNIPQILIDTDRWIRWTRHFKPISGSQNRLEFPRAKYIGTTFCYGCNLGPSQTARSLKGTSRKQIAWINDRHITDEGLEKAIVDVVNAYNKYSLPRVWGDGSSASADGTKWDIYEKNLLSEYHIRYGGWGGIGYYHVSDSYIALFSNFISCGVWEGIHILDGTVGNKSEIQPDTLHADTQGQSEAIFGLSALLGIKLMPRIRNWKDLTFHKPEKNFEFQNLEVLFSSQIDWKFIERHLPDMLRVAVSISKGYVMPSTILRRLNSSSRKSKLYFAFRELGRAVRTTFLLDYISDIDLRQKIQSSTNKSEEWNAFIHWVSFGGQSIRKQDRAGQQKFIRYNHLVSNLIVLHNVVNLTHSLNKISNEGFDLNCDLLSSLAPYRTEGINRFGEYPINEEDPNYDIYGQDLKLPFVQQMNY